MTAVQAHEAEEALQPDAVDITNLVRTGWVKKRSGRMSRWTSRFFLLTKTGRLLYKVEEEDENLKAAYDLAPGCIVTDIVEEFPGSSKKMYSFWVIWPFDKRSIDVDEETPGAIPWVPSSDSRDIDNEEVDAANSASPTAASSSSSSSNNTQLRRKLEKQQETLQENKELVTKELERHVDHDNRLSMAPKVAAVALGGVLVGVFTAGFGLVPYLSVVGGLAVAGGGAVALGRRYRKPADSRLIMAMSSQEEASGWKAAIEAEITKVERKNAPAMTVASRNKHTISTLARMLQLLNGRGNVAFLQSCWEFVHEPNMENVRVMQLQPQTLYTRSFYREYLHDKELKHEGSVVRYAFDIIRSTTLDTFLTVMESCIWPKDGTLKIFHAIDDHTDIIRVRLSTHKRNLYLTRFWRLDEDGVYVICFNTVTMNEVVSLTKLNGEKPLMTDRIGEEDDVLIEDSVAAEREDMENRTKNHNFDRRTSNSKTPHFGAIVSISPRRSHAEFDNDIPLALLSCIAAVKYPEKSSLSRRTVGGWASEAEAESMLSEFMSQHIIGVKDEMQHSKYGEDREVDDTASVSTALGPLNTLHALQFAGNQLGSGGGWDGSSVLLDNNEASSSEGMVRTAGSYANAIESLGSEHNLIPPVTRHLWHRFPRRRLRQTMASSSDEGGEKCYGREVNVAEPEEGERDVTSSVSRGTEASEASLSSPRTPSRRSGTYTRSRSISVNNEASLLRGKLAAKEYELQRLEMVARKRSDPASQEAFTLLRHQTDELRGLKQEYFKLTGSQYEQSFSGRSYTRLSGNGGVSDGRKRAESSLSRSNSSSLVATTGIDGGYEGHLAVSSSACHRSEAKLDLPSHWQPTAMERAEISTGCLRDDHRLSTSTLFVVGLVLSVSLANLLNYL